MKEKPNNKILTGQNISKYLNVVGEEAEIVNEDSNSSNNQKETQKPNENISQERTGNKQTLKKPNTKLELEMKEAVNNQDAQQIDNILKKIGDNDPAFKKALNGVYLAEKLNSKTLGKIVYHNFKEIKPKKGKPFINEIPNEYTFDATTEAGFHTFASWNKEKGSFYIESKKDLTKIIEKINKINPESGMGTLLEKENPNQIIGKINNMKEEEFKKILLTGNEEAKKPLTKNEIKIQKNNTEIVKLKKELEEMDIKIAELEAMILALPDDDHEPITQPQATKEPKVEKLEEISLNEKKEGKITSKDFKELVRLSKFFLENPKEPTTIGSIENKYPELFKEINKIEERRQDDLSTLISTDKNGKKYYAAFTELGNLYANTKEEIENKINSKYDAELAELEKSKTTTDSTVSLENQEPEKVSVDEEKEEDLEKYLEKYKKFIKFEDLKIPEEKLNNPKNEYFINLIKESLKELENLQNKSIDLFIKSIKNNNSEKHKNKIPAMQSTLDLMEKSIKKDLDQSIDFYKKTTLKNIEKNIELMN